MPAFIVCEAGVNHLGDRAKMLAFCDAAKACGSDAVKFQAYDAEKLCKRRGTPYPEDGGRIQTDEWMTLEEIEEVYPEFALLHRCELTDADLDAIAAHCKAIGFKWFASVFDPSQVERVLSRGACALKISHKENEYDELISACAAKDVPLYVSGQSSDTWDDLTGAEIKGVYGTWVYPAVLGAVRPCLSELRFGTYSGYSSHWTDYRVPATAALYGAEYLEAHLKLSDQDPEAAWSLSVEDFGKMVKLAREYESWL